jgi:hypothetical protein
MTFDDAVAVMGPPPHDPVTPLGVDTTRPAGSVSVNPTPVNDVPEFGLVMVKLSVVVPLSETVAAPNFLPITGGAVIVTKPFPD